MKNLQNLFVLLLLAGLASCGGGQKNDTEKVLSVRIDTVKYADEDATLQFPGRVVSSEDVNVSFKVSGIISRVLVTEGQHVSAGQLLAEMDPTDYQVQLSATEAEYANIKAEAERVIGLYKDGATTASNYDKARYGLTQIEAKLQNHKNQLAYCKIYAPISGTVQHKFFDSRETVAAGMPIVSLVGSGAPEIEVNLPASTYLKKDKFTNFTATLNILPGEIVPLKLISILAKANTNQLFTMRLKLQDSTKNIAPGMSAWVTIETADSVSAAVRIPSTALVEENGLSYAYLYTGSTQMVKKVEVHVNSLHTDGTAIVTGSVHPGDLIVSSGAHFIKDGVRVHPLGRISKTNVGGLL